MAYFPTPKGQKTMAESAPVVIASDQTPVAIAQEIVTPAYNLSSRQRISKDYTIFEAKTINAFQSLIWQTYLVNGSATYTNNILNLQVADTGEGYAILQSSIACPYLSAQSNWAEFSVIGLTSETDIIKYMGMYSTTSVAPYQDNKDGFWIECDGIVTRFKAANNGVITANVVMTSWDNYAAIASYNFANTATFRFNFVWNDCVELLMFLDNEWVIVHTLKNVGGSNTLLYGNPYPYARCEVFGYAVNSTIGLKVIDVSFGCENALENQNRVYAFNNFINSVTPPPPLSTPTGSNLAFALMKFEKTPNYAATIQLIDFDVIVNTTDQCIIGLMIDPNVTEAGATLLTNTGCQEITVTAFTASSPVTGLKAGYPKFVWSRNYNSITTSSVSNVDTKNSFFSFLQNALDQTAVPLYLVTIPLSANQVTYVSANLRVL